MAELFVYKEDQPDNGMPSEHQRKQFDVGMVFEDGTCVEPPSPGSVFLLVKVPGMSIDDAKQLMEPVWIDEKARTVSRLYARGINGVKIAPATLDTFLNNREITITAVALNALVVDRS